MPLVPIDISQGALQNVDKSSLTNEGRAVKLENILLTDTGANRGRPGLSSFASLTGNQPVLGMAFFNNKIVAVGEDRRIYTIDSSGTVAEITGTDGALAGSSTPKFAEDGTYLAIAGGGAPQRWSGSGTTENMPGSPPSTKQVVFIDGYWILMLNDDQEMRLAGPTSATRESWSADDFFQAEVLPDNLVALEVLNRQLLAFGSKSLQLFQNYGDAVTPFQPTVTIDSGLLAADSVVNALGTVAWLDDERTFVVLQGREAVPFSFPFDKQVQEFTTVSDCKGFVIHIDNQYLLLWVFPTEERAFVFDYKTRQYVGEWRGYKDESVGRFRANAYVWADAWDKHYVGDYSDGTIWELTNSSFADGSEVRRCIRRTGEIDHGTANRKKSIYYNFHMKRGVATSSVTDPRLQVRVLDDDKPWSDVQHISMGATGDYQSFVRVRIPGIYRKRQIEIVCTDAVEFVLNKIEENVELLSS